MMLLGRRPSSSFAHANKVGSAARMAQDGARTQVIEQDRIRALQPIHRLERQKLRVAWAGAHKADKPSHATSPVIR